MRSDTTYHCKFCKQLVSMCQCQWSMSIQPSVMMTDSMWEILYLCSPLGRDQEQWVSFFQYLLCKRMSFINKSSVMFFKITLHVFLDKGSGVHAQYLSIAMLSCVIWWWLLFKTCIFLTFLTFFLNLKYFSLVKFWLFHINKLLCLNLYEQYNLLEVLQQDLSWIQISY